MRGLTDIEVEFSRKKNGTNYIESKKTEKLISKYFNNFKDPLIIILLIALIINLLFVLIGKAEWYETVGILISIMISTFISTISEYKNENMFQKMRQEALKVKCKVFRNDGICEILISDLVKDDICLLESGDIIPADGILIEGKISVNQSSLNGESIEVEKYPQHVDEKNWKIDLFKKSDVARESYVTDGLATMKVLAIGENTIYGKSLTESEEPPKSPLKLKLSRLADGISKFGYIGAIIVVILHMVNKILIKNDFDLSLIVSYLHTPEILSDFIDALILGIILIVVAVPEGLPLMIAIVCSINMKKMLKDNVLVRKIVGIETAGSLNILFSDKTGTLTKGALTVSSLMLANGKIFNDYSNLSNVLKDLFWVCLVGSSFSKKNGQKIIGGNSTEKSLFEFVKENKNIDITKEVLYMFNSKNKYSKVKISGEYNFIVIKGAPEYLLNGCDFYYDEFGREVIISDTNKIFKAIDEKSREGYRVILVVIEKSDGKRTALGFLFLRDEIRPEAVSAINEVKKAGIKVVMITGDKKETAVNVAEILGLIKNKDDIVLTSEDLSKMTDENIKNKICNLAVVARAMPSDKTRMVKICQEMGMVVGMTGDGVNDAPALKKCDVGFSMGTGSEISKDASDIIILDNNFLSIKKAILYGRTIYNNIKKFITFQLTINVAAMSISIIGPIIGIDKALDITQMLWINLVMDTLAAIAFGEEAPSKIYMLEKPKSRNENIIDKNMWSAIIVDGLFISALSLLMFISPFIKSMFRPNPKNLYFYTGYFSFFIFSSIFNAFNTRTDSIYLFENIKKNNKFIVTMLLISIIQIFMTHFGGTILRTKGLTSHEWIFVIFLSALVIPVDIIRKILFKIKTR